MFCIFDLKINKPAYEMSAAILLCRCQKESFHLIVKLEILLAIPRVGSKILVEGFSFHIYSRCLDTPEAAALSAGDCGH